MLGVRVPSGVPIGKALEILDLQDFQGFLYLNVSTFYILNLARPAQNAALILREYAFVKHRPCLLFLFGKIGNISANAPSKRSQTQKEATPEMKKISVKTVLSAALAVGILSTSAFAAPADSAPADSAAPGSQVSAYTVEDRSSSPIRVWGSITEKGEGRITLKNSDESDPYHEIIVNITEDTMVLDAVTGASKTFADLKENETVYAYVGPAMTRSLPPIAGGVLVLCNIPADYGVPAYAEVQSVTVDENGNVSALTDADVILHLNKDTEISPYLTKNAVGLNDIQPGVRVLAWYDVVTLSLPAQATPTKVIVFPYSYEGYVALTENGITLNGGTDFATKVTEGKLLLPVRALAETLGCTVEWVNDTRSVVVSKGDAVIYTFAIGGGNVTLGESETALAVAPQLIDGVTYAAVDDLLALHNLKLAR
ncbi:MAG: copper amine oxidase N-terminal domain-containing protein [Clostridia bacterium]|nr:copper amine oxidase N-terminal domain-containing protein [Clostridia bacterium]